jgi:hypothetical protein
VDGLLRSTLVFLDGSFWGMLMEFAGTRHQTHNGGLVWMVLIVSEAKHRRPDHRDTRRKRKGRPSFDRVDVRRPGLGSRRCPANKRRPDASAIRAGLPTSPSVTRSRGIATVGQRDGFFSASTRSPSSSQIVVASTPMSLLPSGTFATSDAPSFPALPIRVNRWPVRT